VLDAESTRRLRVRKQARRRSLARESTVLVAPEQMHWVSWAHASTVLVAPGAHTLARADEFAEPLGAHTWSSSAVGARRTLALQSMW
jgi:hypothetical protein